MKLAEIQQKLKVPKNQLNKFGGYNYRSAEDIIEAAKLLINPLGYALFLRDEVIEVGGRVYVKATVSIVNGDESYSATGWAREDETVKGMSAAQITGSASSYARKYALNGLFAIDDTKDADATNTHGKEAKDDLQAAIERIRSCQTLTELADEWTSGKKYQGIEEYQREKNAQKVKLQKP